MFLDEIFFEQKELEIQFLHWFSSRNIRGFNVNEMPEFMAVQIVVKWLEKKGLYIDRDTECREMKILDYLESEPEEAIIINVIDLIDGNEEWFKAAIEKCIEIINNRK